MIPREKAKELVDKMLNEQSNTKEIYDAKQCALIAVDEIFNYENYFIQNIPQHNYWHKVKQEIERL